ncbi:prolyl aminopeptidase [Peptostreptococcus porci]|uniref:Proline iminopeptidase n=1 Tax=Peptostreptococcus porci TaxID=2652282 RepID=A0A6N7X1I6_9FIRM|nr:prolyl aminopeptidase [Peptostreptococcus porci]MDY5435221.1 prolyl aminopeptidase [Peptostreptococcus porci]MST62830.1 prolyl aminopeptidase [Peptostreptococcus porci]
MSELRTLYPAIEANFTDFIKVDDIHNIYYEESGNPNGKPVVFLHGGPGCGTAPSCRQFFDPEFYRIILFDQRGSGKSTPHAELRGNDTDSIICDIEMIREKLGIEKWLVFGGSWGSTLALSYALQHPQRVIGLILRGIFLGRQEDIDWIYQEGGASNIFPDKWEKYVSIIPEEERNDMVTAYYKRLTSEDRAVRVEAARAWSMWEGSIINLHPNDEVVEDFGDEDYAISMATIECHFWMNNMFRENMNYILDESDIIKDIPTIIAHGRYDMDCRYIGAYLLSKKLNNCKLYPLVCGHSSGEPEMIDCLVKATDEFKELF